MYLSLYPKQKSVFVLSLFHQDQAFSEEFTIPNHELLPTVTTFLHNHKLTPQMVQGIALVQGSGSFADTRVASTLVNTWAFVLGIPVVGVGESEVLSFELIHTRLSDPDLPQYVLPVYSAEPNIGQKKV